MSDKLALGCPDKILSALNYCLLNDNLQMSCLANNDPQHKNTKLSYNKGLKLSRIPNEFVKVCECLCAGDWGYN